MFTFVKRLMRKGPRCQEPSTGILIMKQIKRPGTVKLIYFMVWKCFPGNKQHTKSWRCTRNADKHSARIHRDHRGEKITKHRKHTGCISQISLWGIFLIVIISHYMTLGVSSTCFDRDCFQFSNLCLSVLFHALWLLRFSRNNSCHGASHGLSEDALTPLFSRHNTTEISGNTYSVYYLIFTQLSLFYKKPEAFEALFTQGFNFRDHM